MANWQRISPALSRSYLDVLPEEVYDKSDSSHLVRFIDALCGDASIGDSRKKLLLKRLQTALADTRYQDLDGLYSSTFGLKRLESEEYDTDPEALITWADYEDMNVKDAKYRSRIWDYMLAFQYGATKRGLELAAQAGCGIPCQVIDLSEYDMTTGLLQFHKEHGQEEEGVENFSLDGRDARNSEGSRFLVVVMTDRELTDDETQGIADALERIKPQESSYRITTRATVLDRLGSEYFFDEDVEINEITSSSDWWNVVNYVTGRLDWDYEKYPTMWITPGERVEAPRQALVLSQESNIPLTYMTTGVTASTEHMGPYNTEHTLAFPSLAEAQYGDVMAATGAVSRTRSKWYTSGFYGGEDSVDWSYPVGLNAALTAEASEDARYSRFWSSDERAGNEWLEAEIARTIPFNSIEFKVSRKPLRIIPYVSSDEQTHEWRRIRGEGGQYLSFETRTWGGSSIAGDYLDVSFSFPTIKANAIRLEFERLDVPYYYQQADGLYVERDFLWSVDLSDLSFSHHVLSRDDYEDSVYLDPYGNKVETELRVMSADKINSGEGYWVSQPNVVEDSVEYLILDVSKDGEAQRVSYLDIEAIYSGCQMNIYSSDDGEVWTPYTGDFTLRTGRTELDARKVRYLKLEFTGMAALPYEVISHDVMVKTRLFPQDAKSYVESVTLQTREMTDAERLLTTVEESSATWDKYQFPHDVTTRVDGSVMQSRFTTNSDYQLLEDTPIVSYYGIDNFAAEQPYAEVEQDIVNVARRRFHYRFANERTHDYEVKEYPRTYDLAFVVGIKSIKVGYSRGICSLDNLDPLYLKFDGDTHIANNSGWEVDRVNERIHPSTRDDICRMETYDIQCGDDFRSFDIAVDQKQAIQKFEHPSDMSTEWHGLDCEAYPVEFGTNGRTFQADVHQLMQGIESDPVMVHANSIARADVQLFTTSPSKWELECLDATGSQVFSMRYDVPPRKWTNIGVTFVPQPGGTWWDRDYPYRVRIPLFGQLNVGDVIFLPQIEFSKLVEAGITSASDVFSMTDVRLVCYDGIRSFELPLDITEDMEWWFAVQYPVPAGAEADGRYHVDANAFSPAYFLYFGNKNEHTALEKDWRHLYKEHSLDVHSGDISQSGTKFTDEGEYVELYDYRLQIADGESGYIEFELQFDDGDPLKTLADGTEEGINDVRFLMEFEDDFGRVAQLYTYGKQLTFVIRETDGFESAWVGKFSELSTGDTARHKLLLTWGARGSTKVYVNGSVDEANKRRRAINVYIDSKDNEWHCIDNVYDEQHYFEGVY